jgi:hypothetical protein
VLTDEIGVAHLEDHRADELVESRRSVGSCVGCGCGQTEPRDGGRCFECLDPRPAPEVMDLVDDEQPKAVADRVHVAITRSRR